MKQFIKTNDGLEDVTKPKVKVYDDIAALQVAVDNGDIAEGEIVATKFVDNAQDDSMNVEAIENQISNINALIPNGTSALNQLVNASQVAQMGSVSSVTVGSTQYSPDADGDVCIPAYPPDLSGCAGLNCVGTVTSVNSTAPDANGDVTINLPPDLSGCPGLNCTGTVTAVCAGSTCYTPTSGVITLPNGASATITLSGSDLTITF